MGLEDKREVEMGSHVWLRERVAELETELREAYVDIICYVDRVDYQGVVSHARNRITDLEKKADG